MPRGRHFPDRRLVPLGALVGCLLAAGAAAQQPLDLGRDADLDQPIEINADSLEVRQNENVAIFQGNVDATQGRIRLKANELRVHYTSGGNDRQTDEGESNIAGAISRLDAIGDVFISSPTETAQGRKGIYDVSKRLVTLEGDVVLTRDENVLRGDRLIINLESGVTTLDGSTSGAGKVRGIFVPQRDSGESQ